MTVIDIGANLGVYSLPMARLVENGGQVFAYEPGSEARTLLQKSRELNKLENLHIIPSALSNRRRTGRLVFGHSSELNAIGEGGPGEDVPITSLDDEVSSGAWPPPDFVKIDAEGEEERILAGGEKFFARYSPLILFEIKAGESLNERLRSLFPAMGYRLYRQLGDAPVLVPDDPTQPLDEYELNLFAAKSDRANALGQEGLLTMDVPNWEAQESDRTDAEKFWSARGFVLPKLNASSGDEVFRASLIAYAAWRASDRPVAARCAALSFALKGMRQAASQNPSAGRLSTLSRIAWEWGARAESFRAAESLLNCLQSQSHRFDEPFLPASRRFDAVSPNGQLLNWVACAAAEQFVSSCAYSSFFANVSSVVDWLCSQPFCSSEVFRRQMLTAILSGAHPTVAERLRTPADDNLNADLWRSGELLSIAS